MQDCNKEGGGGGIMTKEKAGKEKTHRGRLYRLILLSISDTQMPEMYLFKISLILFLTTSISPEKKRGDLKKALCKYVCFY